MLPALLLLHRSGSLNDSRTTPHEQGFVDMGTGEIELNFDASFRFNAGAIYKVETHVSRLG